MAYKVELRKPKSVLTKQWEHSGVFVELAEAEQEVAWWKEYDLYYSQDGWEYKITEVKDKQRR